MRQNRREFLQGASSTAPEAPREIQTFADTTGFMRSGDDQYFPFVQAAVSAADGAAPPMTTEESLHVLRAIFAAYRAADTRSTVQVS